MNFLKNNFVKPQRSIVIFGVFMLLFVTLLIFVEKLNGKFYTNDFEVYYLAAKDYFEGKNPYLFAYGEDTGFFKYPPTTLYFFYFTTKVSYFTAQIIHSILLLVAFVFGVYYLRKILFEERLNQDKKYNWMLYTAFFFTVIQLVREFHIGNINLFLFFFFTLGLYGILKNKLWMTIFAWALMVILKPIVVIVFIPLLLFKKWRIIAGLALLGAFFFILPIVNNSFHGLIEIWRFWFIAVSKHGSYIISQYSLTYLANYYFGIQSTWLPSIFVLLIVLTFGYFYSKRQMFSIDSFIEFSIVLMAFTPNFFVTDTEHFLLSMPLLILIVYYLLKLKNWMLWVFFSIILMPFTLRSNDLMSASLSDFIAEIGLLGIVNLTAIFFFYFVSFKVNKMENLPETTKL